MADLFYKYYDALFQNKDYSREIDMVFEINKDLGSLDPDHVLEIGCGTGSHTVRLAERVKQLIAIDIDEKMVALAQQKVRNQKKENALVIFSAIEDLKASDFDLVIALFNVVTYIPTAAGLDSFMQAVAKRLKTNGLFIFDAWNGIAAILDPPGSKETRVKVGSEEVACKLTAETDLFSQAVALNYRLEVSGGAKPYSEDFGFSQTLWTPMQIRTALEDAGLEVLKVSPLLQPDKEAAAGDWKIQFVAKK